MADLVVRAVGPGDILELAANMRGADVAEAAAIGETNLASAVAASVSDSVMCWTIAADGQVVCMMGVAPLTSLLSETGVPWMLGTPLVHVHRRSLVRLYPDYLARMRRAFPHLLNFVHADNAVSIRWLKTAGFVLQPAAPFGPLGAPFHRFDLKD